MDEEDRPKGNVMGGTGITSAGDVTFGDNSGQVGIGQNINQSQVQSINQTDLKELKENLFEFHKGIDKLGLESDDHDIVSANINSAIKEGEKEEPQLSKIKGRFESAIETLKEAGKTISNVSELYEPAKKIAKILGIAASFLL